jgi:hypothetical protein
MVSLRAAGFLRLRAALLRHAAKVTVLRGMCISAVRTLSCSMRLTPDLRMLEQKEDLSMFRDSSVSFFDPGDTAADAVCDRARE